MARTLTHFDLANKNDQSSFPIGHLAVSINSHSFFSATSFNFPHYLILVQLNSSPFAKIKPFSHSQHNCRKDEIECSSQLQTGGSLNAPNPSQRRLRLIVLWPGIVQKYWNPIIRVILAIIVRLWALLLRPEAKTRRMVQKNGMVIATCNCIQIDEAKSNWTYAKLKLRNH